MEHEEHEQLQELHAAFSDQELQELEGRIVSPIPPEHMVLFMDAILSALPKADSVGMLAAMKSAMPPQPYAALMQAIEARHESRRQPASGA